MSEQVTRDLFSMMEFPKEGVFSKVIARGECSNHTLMCLAKGSDITEHTSTREGIVMVLRGKGVFVLQGVPIEMKPGVMIFMPKSAPHSLRAEEDTAFLLSLAGAEKS